MGILDELRRKIAQDNVDPSAAHAPEDGYVRKVQQQIDQFADAQIHDLPDIFHHWSHHFVLPGVQNVFGVDTMAKFYAGPISERANSGPFSYLSVGCGDGEVEISLARELIAQGHAQFHIDAYDLSPLLIERMNARIAEEQLQGFVTGHVSDLNHDDNVGINFDVVMANHSLHHILELENLFDRIYDLLGDGGMFITADMIGRNGHMRWPETRAIIDIFWPMLEERHRYHHQLRRLDADHFVDHDCSNEGFEGIRAQDILEIILRKFHPYKFYGYGGFIDVFADRGYGHNFSTTNQRDVTFIESMAKLNDYLLDAGVVKPTIMMAYFTKDNRGERFYRGRSAARSVRRVDDDVAWLQP